jgi:hypothetical protein
VKEAIIKKTPDYLELLFPRGPCVGTIAQPPLASQKSDIVFCDKPRGPCAGIIDQPPLTPAAVNKGSLRWHHRPATPRLTAPARHRRRFSTLGGPEWVPSSRGASPPWRFAPPLALRPGDRTPPRNTWRPTCWPT